MTKAKSVAKPNAPANNKKPVKGINKNQNKPKPASPQVQKAGVGKGKPKNSPKQQPKNSPKQQPKKAQQQKQQGKLNGNAKVVEQKAAQKKIEKELDLESEDDFMDEDDISGSDDDDTVNETLNSSVLSGDVEVDSDDDDDVDDDDDEDDEVTSEEEVPSKTQAKPAQNGGAKKNEKSTPKAKEVKTVEKKPKKELTPEEIEARKNSVSVFIGNLPLNTKRKNVHKLFDKFGKILSIRFRSNTGSKINKKKQKVTGPNIIAFVDYADEKSAKSALALNGHKLKEKILRVDIHSQEKQSTIDPKRTIFVGNLKYSVTDDILHETFSTCGEIDYVRPLQGPKGCKGTAFVCFRDAAAVVLAIKLNKTLIEGREARVELYTPSKSGQSTKDGKPADASGAARRVAEKDGNKTKPEFVGQKNSNIKKQKNNKKPNANKVLAKKIAPKK